MYVVTRGLECALVQQFEPFARRGCNPDVEEVLSLESFRFRQLRRFDVPGSWRRCAALIQMKEPVICH